MRCGAFFFFFFSGVIGSILLNWEVNEVFALSTCGRRALENVVYFAHVRVNGILRIDRACSSTSSFECTMTHAMSRLLNGKQSNK